MCNILSEGEVEAFTLLFEAIYKRDVEATKVSFALLEVVHIWDDLIDKDREVSSEEINQAFLGAMVDIGGSYLWDSEMAASFFSTYLKWTSANTFEEEGREDLVEKAWILRADVYSIFPMLSAKLYGREFGEWASRVCWETYGEKLEDFKQEVLDA